MSWLKAIQVVIGASEVAKSVTPKLEDEVTVEVIGEPGSKKRDLYFLALSTAYGIARPGRLSRLYSPPPAMLMLEYDAADDWVRVTLRYSVGAMDFINRAGAGAFGSFAAFLGPPGIFLGAGVAAASLASEMPIINGPKQSVEGGPASVPFSILNIDLPSEAQIWNGKAILTDQENVQAVGGQWVPTPNPKPSGDGRSRGSVETSRRSFGSVGTNAGGKGTILNTINTDAKYLIPLVFAALSAPGSQNQLTFTPPSQGPGGTG